MKFKERIKLIAILLSVTFIFISCSKKEGDWDDIIELSQKEVTFNSNADSITVNTKGDFWWISNIRLNEKQINFGSVNTTSSNFEIIETEFTISRKNTKELRIVITENSTVNQRELIIGLQAGNYFDNIKVIQKGK